MPSFRKQMNSRTFALPTPVSYTHLFPTRYSSINLDGGNAVFSPSRKTVIISDRIFSENPEWNEETLGTELSKLLDARIIFIESLPSDFTCLLYTSRGIVLGILHVLHGQHPTDKYRDGIGGKSELFHILPEEFFL